MTRFVVDLFVVWYSTPIDLVRALARRPAHIVELTQDDDGRFRLIGLVCGNGGRSTWS